VVVEPLLVSLALRRPGGPETAVLAAWELGEVEVLVTEALLGAYKRRVGRDLTEGFRRFGVPVAVEQRVLVTGDAESDDVLSAAGPGRAEFIFAASPVLLELAEFGGTPILSAAQFVSMVALAARRPVEEGVA
jgi:hypothetical protein